MKSPFFAIVLALSLSGCSLIYSYSDNLPQRVDQWIIDNKYNVALNTISYIKPSKPIISTCIIKPNPNRIII